MNAEHTPTPWMLGGTAVILANPPERGSPVYIAKIERGIACAANAEFLCRAVNAHDDLVAALQGIADARMPGEARRLACVALAKLEAKS